MYRPEGFENPNGEGCGKDSIFCDLEQAKHDAFEAGAEAYEKALIKKGTHYEAGVILDPGLIMEIVRSGTLVFIPDEERKTVNCPNCSKHHEPVNGNGYCQDCSAQFARLGMRNYIDQNGELRYEAQK